MDGAWFQNLANKLRPQHPYNTGEQGRLEEVKSIVDRWNRRLCYFMRQRRVIEDLPPGGVYPTLHRRARRRNTKWLISEARDTGRMLINRLPVEALIDAMGFLNRDDLDVLQLTTARFDELAEDYFPSFPLRAVHSFTLRSTKRSRKTRLRIVCIPSEGGGSGSANRIMQADEDPHLWLHHCVVQTVKFENFLFTHTMLAQLATLKASSTHINYVVLEYEDARQPPNYLNLNYPNLDNSVTRLFSNAAFRACKGAVFRFDTDCAGYRPSVHTILRLDVPAIVVDYEDLECDRNILDAIVVWLSEDGGQLRTGTSKSLSLKGMEVEENELRRAIIKLKSEFSASRHPCAWIFNTDFETDDDIDEKLVMDDFSQSDYLRLSRRSALQTSDATGEELTIVSRPDQPLRILRE